MRVILGLLLAGSMVIGVHTQTAGREVKAFQIRAIVSRETLTSDFTWTIRPVNPVLQMVMLRELREAKDVIKTVRFDGANKLIIERMSDQDWIMVFPKIVTVFEKYMIRGNDLLTIAAYPNYGPSAPIVSGVK